MSITDYAKQLRAARGWRKHTQEEAAAAMSVSTRLLSAWESGESSPTLIVQAEAISVYIAVLENAIQ